MVGQNTRPPYPERPRGPPQQILFCLVRVFHARGNCARAPRARKLGTRWVGAQLLSKRTPSARVLSSINFETLLLLLTPYVPDPERRSMMRP